MSVLERIGSFFSLRDEEEPQEFGNVVPLSANRVRAGGVEVAIFAPSVFGDVTDVADALRARHVVILNLQGADRSLLQRVVDFTSGVAYTIDGKIQKLADAIYLVVPAGVSVNTAGVREAIQNDALLDLGSRPYARPG
ncbi:MAG: cell division protein SepF [Candidatus Eremiobacteraeota bacterium]|nr:cell division protein SepF [Candidatus Eremiobacteraeota bacterium]MBV8354714.1 cell division protein SepF [Candidatus Eremiobacteraeota bacterium]